VNALQVAARADIANWCAEFRSDKIVHRVRTFVRVGNR
jgi:hypothetical protein